MYEFNIALLGKNVWNCISNPDSLVSRVLKSRYYLDSHILKASKGKSSSFIWTGIWQAKKTLSKGFCWVVGDDQNIKAIKDPWLSRKQGVLVDYLHIYEEINEYVSNLFYSGTKVWDTRRVCVNFSSNDA